MTDFRQMDREIEEATRQRIEQGYHGEEYERWKLREPVANRRLVSRCCEEVQPLYEFIINYAKQSADAGRALEFDVSLLLNFDKYTKMLWESPDHQFKYLGAFLSILSGTLEKMVKNEMSYLKGMEEFYTVLRQSNYITTGTRKKTYKGKHFEALVNRYHERRAEWIKEGERIAAENVRKRGEQVGGLD